MNDRLGIVTTFIHNIVVYNIPLLYGTVGEILIEKSGSLNLGVEGIMFMGGAIGLGGVFYYEKAVESPSAFLAVLIGLLCAFIAGGIASLIFSFLTITLRANQNVTGLTLTIFGGGVANFFGGTLNSMAGGVGQISVAATSAVYRATIPGLSDLGLPGRLLFSYGFMVYLAIVLAFIGGIVMIPISMIFLVGSLFSFQTRINAGFTPWRSTTGAMSRDDNHQLLTFNASAFYPQGALALIAGIIILMIGMGIGGVFIAAGILALCNGYRLQNRVVIGVSGESMIFTPGLYADTYVIPLRDVAVVERSNNDAKVRLLIPSTGRSITLRKKMLAGDNVSDTFAAILAKLTTV